MISSCCIICLMPNIDCIEIFGKLGESQGIAGILLKHFWFKVIEPSDISPCVCLECWAKTYAFHEFYRSVEHANREYFLTNVNKSDYGHKVFEKHSPKHYDDEDDDVDEVESINKPLDLKSCAGWVSDTGTNAVKESLEKPMQSKLNEWIDGTKSEIQHFSAPFSDGKNIDNDCNDSNKSCSDRVTLNKGSSVTNKDQDNVDLLPSYFDKTCDQCDEIFQTLADAQKHYRSQHNCARGYLKCCSKRLYKPIHVRDHMQWHQNPNGFTCDLCNKSFFSKGRVAIHMINHIPNECKKFKCDKCGKRFSRQYQLNNHKRICNCKSLKTHNQSMHEHDNLPCSLCHQKFKSQVTLNNHMASVHMHALSHICEFCGKTFKSKQNLLQHLSQHSDTFEKRVQCSYCGAWLKNRVSLKKHVRRTHKSSPKKCPYCDKIKSNQESLTSHILVVHTKPSHQCTICDKSFTKAISLTEHIASHTGEDLYTCGYCSKSFKSNSNMYKHKKMSHPEQWSVDRKRKP